VIFAPVLDGLPFEENAVSMIWAASYRAVVGKKERIVVRTNGSMASLNS